MTDFTFQDQRLAQVRDLYEKENERLRKDVDYWYKKAVELQVDLQKTVEQPKEAQDIWVYTDSDMNVEVFNTEQKAKRFLEETCAEFNDDERFHIHIDGDTKRWTERGERGKTHFTATIALRNPITGQ